MTALPTDPIRAEHRELMPHVGHIATAAAEVTEWDVSRARRVLPRIVSFLRDDLMPHAAAEEEVLYPAVDRFIGEGATATMIVDHIVIGESVEELAASVDRVLADWENRELVADLSRRLAAIAAILRLHFRKEEQVLLPILDAGLSLDEGRRLLHHVGEGSHVHDHV